MFRMEYRPPAMSCSPRGLGNVGFSLVVISLSNLKVMSVRPIRPVWLLRDASEGALENSLLYAFNVVSLQGDHADQHIFHYCAESTLQVSYTCDCERERP